MKKRHASPVQEVVTSNTDSVARNAFILAFVIWLIGVAALAVTYKILPPVLPLFYSLVVSDKQLTDKPFIWMMPVMSLVFIVTHWWMSRINPSQDAMFDRILAVSAAFTSLLFSVATLKIIELVL